MVVGIAAPPPRGGGGPQEKIECGSRKNRTEFRKKGPSGVANAAPVYVGGV